MRFRPHTYSEIIEVAKAIFRARTGVEFPFRDGDILTALIETCAIQDDEQYAQISRLLTERSLLSARGDALDAEARKFGAYRVPEQAAAGAVKFTRDSGAVPVNPVAIPPGTVVLVPATATTVAVEFTVDAPGTTIAAGQPESPYAPITASVPGESGNVPASSISALASPITGVATVVQIVATVGGRNRETDEELRARVVGSLQSLVRGTTVALDTAARNCVSPGSKAWAQIGSVAAAGNEVDYEAVTPGAEGNQLYIDHLAGAGAVAVTVHTDTPAPGQTTVRVTNCTHSSNAIAAAVNAHVVAATLVTATGHSAGANAVAAAAVPLLGGRPVGENVSGAHVYESFVADTVYAYIDNGDTISSIGPRCPASPDEEFYTYIATGGELYVRIPRYPIDAGYSLTLNGGALVSGVDYWFDTTSGMVVLNATLTAGDVLRANFAWFSGLRRYVQRVLNGEYPENPTDYPGWKPAGQVVSVLPITNILSIAVEGSLTHDPAMSGSYLRAEATARIAAYLGALDVGDVVYRTRLSELVMSLPGVLNFTLTLPALDANPTSTGIVRVTTVTIS